MKFNVIFCFLKNDGSVETDDYGCEMYHREEVEAESKEQAVEKIKDLFKGFEKQPEIVDIVD